MVTVVVFGSLRQVFDARARLRPYLDQSEEMTLVVEWFRKTMQALIADYDDGPHRFAGTAVEISGLTGSPVLGPPGTPTPFRWLIKYDPEAGRTLLEYREDRGTPLRILSWSGQEGRFSFFAEDGNWHANWPLSASAEAQTTFQLPQLIRLSGAPSIVLPTIVAAPRASRLPPPPAPPLLGERRVQ